MWIEQGFGVSTDAAVTISALLCLALGVGLATAAGWIHVLIMVPTSSHTCCVMCFIADQAGELIQDQSLGCCFHTSCVALCSKTY